MPTPTEIFDEIEEILKKYCDAPDVVVKVKITFSLTTFALEIIRHLHDANDVFDRSRDTQLLLSESDAALLRTKAQAYFEFFERDPKKPLSTTLSIYPHSPWSFGSTH